MDIWLIRHGETDWNVSGRVQGWTDIPLNQTGRAQAQKLASYLEGIPFRQIYASDLSRALNTARAIAEKTGTPISTTRRLREQYFGQAEGLLREEKERRFPNGIPGAETPQDVEERIRQFLTDLVATPVPGRVILATHGGVVRAALRWLGLQNEPIDNTSITCLKYEGGAFRITAINATPHLSTPISLPTGSRMDISQHG
ncbi:phosphoglycerate mutase [Alicyclobacillus acidoterrestris]|uniref:histidine phosphatase family protein n=1 Tax=Alicyclobacillus suci TaxID=2816080 RepID=UPI0011945452|nr:histidine phosphatase family protein [Alicyclobacillus suci]GEO25801.1 phosphoglycerate mutase [Alicyclobacillus acidoterrestris]